MIWIFVLILSAAYGIGEKVGEDYTITPLKYNTGLYFERLQSLRFYRTQWKLVTSLEITDYLKNRPAVEEAYQACKDICTRRGLDACPADELGPAIIKKLEDSRRYSDMLRATLGGGQRRRSRGTRVTWSAP